MTKQRTYFQFIILIAQFESFPSVLITIIVSSNKYSAADCAARRQAKLHPSKMAVIIVHVVLLLLAYSHATSAIGFDEWCVEHGKVYSGEQERKARQSVFASNIQLVEKLNQKYNSNGVGFAINHFADLTPQEFRQQILLPPRPVPEIPTHKYHKFHLASDRETPDSLDWRDKGVVSSVKDQGSAGSCWAFSTVGNVEGQWARKTGNVTSLSAEQLVDCDNQNCGAHGGWPYRAYTYIKKVGGISTENDYPYCVGGATLKRPKCFPCMTDDWAWRCQHLSRCNQSQSCSAKLNTNNFVPGLKVKSWIAIEKNEAAMKNALFQHGPLSVILNAQQLQFYQHGVWNLPDCDKLDLDLHAVLLVGYGTEKGVNGNEPYWLIKNSWGMKWGTGGYFKLARGNGTCGVDQKVTSAILQ